MQIGRMISELRSRHGLTQEKLAEVLDVSRQAVQKWETGVSRPDMDNLITLSRKFGVSLDSLVLGVDTRQQEEITRHAPVQPEYGSLMHTWELYSADLMVEYRQCLEEGRQVEPYKDLFQAVSALPMSAHREQLADVIYRMVSDLPQAPDYPYVEPSDLSGIRAMSAAAESPWKKQTTPDRKKIEGAWLGRICGCLLGKPLEGIRTDELNTLLKASGNYPMHRYILSADVTDDMRKSFRFRIHEHFAADRLECAPTDDDTNYTVLGAQIVQKYGRQFTPANVAQAWLDMQPKRAYCTAERAAYRNFVAGYEPPSSAMYKNPYREWIGAQIRADYFGYICPGDPAQAADMAWRDACISHVKNGIYGEMFVAAMLAWAAVCDDPEEVLQAGLAHIPSTSRLHEAVSGLIADWKDGLTEAECFARIHEKYDEFSGHDWCHTISNAEIVTASLLYGAGDFGRSICLAVMAGFDTDCNGATVGSIVGMMYGTGCIGSDWLAPLHGQLDTTIFGVGRVNIADMVDTTLRQAEPGSTRQGR